jgi:hypothetical protein
MVRRPPTVWLLAAGLLGVGCLSPTIPLPPPAIPTQQMLSSTQVLLTSDCGGVQNDAQVTVTNPKRPAPGGDVIGVVAQASGCGSWSAQIFAETGDALYLTQSTDTAEGLPRKVIVGTP